ncbi:hypothetical protein H6F43_21465 [Leptolyngbya sp. FACHB-36]|uniref:hypothetical protein n=1 Tax=Leptolyngbya sp. FACHB-36 TaxID=2692808 RepID=UPI0016807102|nr:hypothetical protein [Leptolyngbya sp. FACHB-36]MBD2022755.1 hypothetical protein [Leptolyngbya sp. FACHB-36]
MTNPGNSPEPPHKGFKITMMQGVIGAVSLAGTTAIPLLVQRALTPPTPTPTQSTPAEIKPAQVAPTASPQNPAEITTNDSEHDGKKGKKKGKKHD